MELEELVDRVKVGKTLLFCGAGFSVESKNYNGTAPALVSELADEICRMGKFGQSSDLRYVADRYIKENKSNLGNLVEMLRKEYMICEVEPPLKSICSFPYRRIYTTNYDDAIEFASKCNKIDRRYFILDDKLNDNLQSDSIIYINGNVCNINSENLQNGKIKLSNSSYLSPNEFEKSDWYYQFKIDLEQANLVLFIGYSLYDIAIEKILFEGKFFDKTCFIVKENEKEDLVWTLKSYGSVFQIGVSQFGKLLGKFDKKLRAGFEDTLVGAITKYSLLECDTIINDNEIRDFIYQGEINQKYIDSLFLKEQKKVSVFRRNRVDEVSELLAEGKNVVITSDFGNGKSVFLMEIESLLTQKGKNVFSVNSTNFQDLIHDFEIIDKLDVKKIFVVDNYAQYDFFIKYVTKKSNNISFLISERATIHQKWIEKIDFSDELYEFNIDVLSEKEIDSMIDLISNLGYWDKNLIVKGIETKKKFLTEDCDAKMASILLYVFNSPQIKSKIKEVLEPLMENESHKRAIMAICFLAVFSLPIEDSIVSKVADNQAMYEAKFYNHYNFKQLFKQSKGDGIAINYSFALSILKNFIDSNLLKEFMLDVAKRFDYKKKRGFKEESIFKNMLKFSVVERVFPDNNKRKYLVNYYDNLKVYVPWLQREPHFWLQYGMAELTFNNLNKVEQCFKNAYHLAKGKYGYYTSDIDTQYARFLLKKAMQESDGNKIISLFTEANGLLMKLDTDIYKLRQIIPYRDLWEKRKHFLSVEMKKKFSQNCILMKKNLELNNKIKIDRNFPMLSECINFLNKFESQDFSCL